MNQYTASLDSIHRIAFSISVCRLEAGSNQVTPQLIDDYLKIRLSIRDWILWSRLRSSLLIEPGPAVEFKPVAKRDN